MPGTDREVRQRQTRNEESLETRGDTKLIDVDVQLSMKEPGHEVARDPQLDPLFECSRLPRQLFARLASQALLGRFSTFASSAKAGESPGGDLAIVRSGFQQQLPLGILKDGADVLSAS